MADQQALQFFYTIGKPEWTLLGDFLSALVTIVNDDEQQIANLQAAIDNLNPDVVPVDPNLPNVANFTASVSYWQNSDGSWFYQLAGGWDVPVGSGITEVVVFQVQDTPPSSDDPIVVQPIASTPNSFKTDWLMMPDQSLLDPGPFKIRLYAVSGDGISLNPIFTSGSRTTPSVLITLVNQAGGLLLDRADPLSFDGTDFQITGSAFVVKNIKSAKIEVDSTLKVGGGTGLFTGPGQVGVFDTGNVMNAWMGRRIQTGICNTAGTAVTRTSGENFLPSMAGQPMAINGVMYTCNAFTDANHVSLTTSAGTQTGVSFAARTSTYGGWFAKLYVGGTAPENSPFYVDNSGQLNILNAFIQLVGSSATVTLDPTIGEITIDGGSGVSNVLTAGGISLYTNNDQTNLFAGGGSLHQTAIPSNGQMLSLHGYSSSGYGPSIIFVQSEGTFAAPTQTLNTDTLGAISGSGTRNTGAVGNEVGRIAFLAAEDFTSSNQGTDIVFYATPIGSVSGAEVGRFHNGVFNAAAYSAANVPGISNSITVGTTLNVTTGTAINSISFTNGSAITSVDFGASSTTSGSFLTGIASTSSITVVTGVTLGNSKSLTWTTGLLTALV